MLTHEEHQAMIMFDRLLMAARDNETVADLLDQTLNVARMIDPRPDTQVVYGPLQRMHFEWQNIKQRLDDLNRKMDNYLNSQTRYGSPTPMPTWPSNPGFTPYVGTTGTMGYGAMSTGSYGAVGGLATPIDDLSMKTQYSTSEEYAFDQTETDKQINEFMKKLQNIKIDISKKTDT